MNKTKLIKAASIAAAAAMLVALPTGCGKTATTETSKTVQSDNGETDLGGVSIKTGLINYYIYTTAVKEAYSSGFSGDYASFDWEQKDADGVRLETDEKDS